MEPNDEALLRLPDVIALTGHSKREIYRLIAAGRFPKQRRLSHKKAVWRRSEIGAWIEATWHAAA